MSDIISPNSPPRKILGAFARSSSFLVQALRHRREVRGLAEFDDRMLRDIGLLRSDVESALAGSVFADPSSALVRRVRRHDRSQRAVPAVRKGRPPAPLVSRERARA